MNPNELKIRFRAYRGSSVVFNIMYDGITVGEIYCESPPERIMIRMFEYDITEIMDETAVVQLIKTGTYDGDGIHARLMPQDDIEEIETLKFEYEAELEMIDARRDW